MTKSLVLITGATGHLGFRALVFALQAGYKARIAVRKYPEQADKIKKTASIQPFLNSIEFAHVPDITAADAFDEAIKGVDYVLHIASPIYTGFGPNDTNWKRDMYDPAEKGTTSMLSAAASEPNVKRVVVTSSVVVVEPKNGSDRAGPYDLKELPKGFESYTASSAPEAYVWSKVLAHLSADKFVEQNKVKFDLVRVLPGYIQGANELYTSAEQMRDDSQSGSNEGTINVIIGKTLGYTRLTAQVFLDDVAKAHVEALKTSVAKGGDNLLIAGNGGDSTPWADFVPIIKRQFPDAVAKGLINPKAEDESMPTKFDTTSSEKALGWKFGGPEEIVKSLGTQYLSFVESA